MIEMKDGDGHAVVAYNLEQDPHDPQAFFIDVYDNNYPFVPYENTNGPYHAGQEGFTSGVTDYGSRIHVFPDHWEFPNLQDDQGEPWHGSLSSLIVMPTSVIPVQPTIPTSLSGITTIITGGAARAVQVTDADGKTLLNAEGSENTDSATLLPDSAVFYPAHGPGPASTPIDLVGGTGPFTQTIAGTGSGTYEDTFMGNNLGVDVQGVPAIEGVNDQLAMDPQQASFRFQTGAASKPVTVEFIAQAGDGSDHTATLSTTSFQGGDDTLSFDPARQVVTFSHAGTATNFTLTLSGFDADGNPVTFTTPSLQVGPGDTIAFTPSDWRNLDAGTVAVTITHADGQQTHSVLAGPDAVITPPVVTALTFDPATSRITVTLRASPFGFDPTVLGALDFYRIRGPRAGRATSRPCGQGRDRTLAGRHDRDGQPPAQRPGPAPGPPTRHPDGTLRRHQGPRRQCPRRRIRQDFPLRRRPPGWQLRGPPAPANAETPPAGFAEASAWPESPAHVVTAKDRPRIPGEKTWEDRVSPRWPESHVALIR